MFRVLGCLYLLVLSSKLFAGTYTACSYYKEANLNTNFWRCAEPTVKKRVCTLVKGVCPACVKYQGDRGEMYQPDFFVEVTSKLGRSHFESLSSSLKNSLEKSAKNYKENSRLPDQLYTSGSNEESNSHFWQVRIIQPAYGTSAFGTYLDTPKGVGTSVLPTCFQGISEDLKDQWVYNLADLPFAAAFAPIGIRYCANEASQISADEIANAVKSASGVVGDLLQGFEMPTIPSLSCSTSMGAKAMMTMNLNPSSDAMSITRMCMRGLGNLIPRTGEQDTEDPFISAVQAAWKFLSLVQDVLPHTGVTIRPHFKWQVVYPSIDPYSSRCFYAGDPARGLMLPSFGPLELKKLGGEPSSYIFAIWRPHRTSTCYEPETAEALWKERIKNVDYNALKGLCSVRAAL